MNMPLSDDEQRRLQELETHLGVSRPRRVARLAPVVSAPRSAVLVSFVVGFGILLGAYFEVVGVQRADGLGSLTGVVGYAVIVLSANLGVTCARNRRRAPGPDGAVRARDTPPV